VRREGAGGAGSSPGMGAPQQAGRHPTIHSTLPANAAAAAARRGSPMVTVWQLGRQEWLRAAAAGNSPMPASWDAPSAPTPCSVAKRGQQQRQ
jgi:hypothetical protein